LELLLLWNWHSWVESALYSKLLRWDLLLLELWIVVLLWESSWLLWWSLCVLLLMTSSIASVISSVTSSWATSASTLTTSLLTNTASLVVLVRHHTLTLRTSLHVIVTLTWLLLLRRIWTGSGEIQNVADKLVNLLAFFLLSLLLLLFLGNPKFH